MFSIISVICAAAGYLIFFLTEMIAFPVILIFAGFIIALIDLVKLYTAEKLQFGDFVKEAFQTNCGSVLAFMAGIVFIFLLIIC